MCSRDPSKVLYHKYLLDNHASSKVNGFHLHSILETKVTDLIISHSILPLYEDYYGPFRQISEQIGCHCNQSEQRKLGLGIYHVEISAFVYI